MAAISLPTQEEFLQSSLRPNVRPTPRTKCSICYERFNSQAHSATGFRGPGACQHVFGNRCLLTWTLSDQPSANTCPLCRTILYQKEETTASIDEELESNFELEDQYLGAREHDVLDYSYPANLMINQTSWYEAIPFITHFWRNLERLAFSDYVPHQEEIEACIVKAAENMHTGYIVRKADLPQFVGLAKKIMWRQMKLGQGFKLGGRELEKWIDKMTQAELWQVV